MKVLFVHNDYAKFSGEEAVVEGQASLLERRGHSVRWFRRSSAEISDMRLGAIRAFSSGVYSVRSAKEMRRILSEDRPDVVHVHNVFPLISPSVLGECRRAALPVVMSVHNYRLACPSGLHLRNGTICEKCCGGREYYCLLCNCEHSLPKSLGYALRSYVARTRGFFRKNVTMYMCLTEFQKQRLITEGFSPGRLAVVPNMTDVADLPSVAADARPYVGYVGRISPEKGIHLLVEAARRIPEIPFRAAGAYHRMPRVAEEAPPNLSFLGPMSRDVISDFYRASRCIVLCSTSYEGFPIVVVEAMMRGTPVIAPRIGGLPEVVHDGTTGLLFEPGDARDLADKIRHLWDSPSLCDRMGSAGRRKAMEQYSPEQYYPQLMDVYETALRLGAGGPADA